jgi:hypothetical protein
MTTYVRQGRGVVVALLLALALPATALADPPKVTTGGTTNVGQDVATLKGRVNPRKNQTTAFFQYGTSRIYGATTSPTDAGRGNAGVAVSAPIGGLAPFTRYHYRLVAQYGPSHKLEFGKDRVFRTDRQPLGLTIVASPNQISAGGNTTLSGTLSGTGYEGEQVILQSNPYPFPGFQQTGNPQIVQSGGTFSFPVLGQFVNTAYRVVLPKHPEIVSPEVGVQVLVRVHLRVGKRFSHQRIRFRGRVTPVQDRARVDIQRRFHGVWVTVAKTHTTDSAAGSSYFQKKVKVRRSGRYRALVTPNPQYTTNVSRVHNVRLRGHR